MSGKNTKRFFRYVRDPNHPNKHRSVTLLFEVNYDEPKMFSFAFALCPAYDAGNFRKKDEWKPLDSEGKEYLVKSGGRTITTNRLDRGTNKFTFVGIPTNFNDNVPMIQKAADEIYDYVLKDIDNLTPNRIFLYYEVVDTIYHLLEKQGWVSKAHHNLKGRAMLRDWWKKVFNSGPFYYKYTETKEHPINVGGPQKDEPKM